MKTTDLAQAQSLLDMWSARGFVLLSLFLQILLVLSAFYRKRTAKKWVAKIISSAYYLAEDVTPYALGLISTVTLPSPTSLQILAFWAPFILLHLGGPDNVTSLSPDENDMWVKHLVNLISRTLVVASMLLRSPPNNPLCLPTILVFVAGVIKYAERTYALYLGSSNRWEHGLPLKPNPGPDYEKLSRVHLAMREAGMPTRVDSVELAPPKKLLKPCSSLDDPELDFGVEGEMDNKSLLQFARFFYDEFMGFIRPGVTFSSKKRQLTHDFFIKRTGHESFKLIEMELNFIYEHLHTKAALLQNMLGYGARWMSPASIVIASFLFFFHDKPEFIAIDKTITYILICGAISLEIASGLMILLSDRNGITLKYYHLARPIADAIINRRRWSETISQRNLIRQSIWVRNRDTWKRKNTFPDRPKYVNCVMRFFLGYKSTQDPALETIKNIIFNELKEKSLIAHNVETATEICQQRGDWALMRSSCYSQLKWSLGEVEFGNSLLLWHIATDLCYYSPTGMPIRDDHPRFCKTISDYMLYLLLQKPAMMNPVAGDWPQIFRDTKAEAQRLFHKQKLRSYWKVCQEILSVDTEIEPAALKGGASKSVLFDGCRLAKQLLNFNLDKRWKLMTAVWVELLAYAAANCEANVLAQQPSQGGELVAFVWLLMIHLGLGNQFVEEPEPTRNKVVLKK